MMVPQLARGEKVSYSISQVFNVRKVSGINGFMYLCKMTKKTLVTASYKLVTYLIYIKNIINP